jgi:uncharacterized membrane protein
MYINLLHTHSYLRYFVLAFLLIVIITSLLGLLNKKSFGAWDNRFSLILLVTTHIQFLAGLILYFVSPWVRFGAETMKVKETRYWTMEHVLGMLIAVVLITIARSTSKRMVTDQAKHKRLFIFNVIALVIIIATIYLSGRGIL